MVKSQKVITLESFKETLSEKVDNTGNFRKGVSRGPAPSLQSTLSINSYDHQTTVHDVSHINRNETSNSLRVT